MSTSLAEAWRSSTPGARLKLIAILLIPFGLLLALIWFLAIAPFLRDDGLVGEGVRLPATIIEARDLKRKVIEYDVTVVIERPGATLDTVRTNHRPLHNDIPRMRPGTRVTVAVDSADPDNILILGQ